MNKLFYFLFISRCFSSFAMDQPITRHEEKLALWSKLNLIYTQENIYPQWYNNFNKEDHKRKLNVYLADGYLEALFDIAKEAKEEPKTPFPVDLKGLVFQSSLVGDSTHLVVHFPGQNSSEDQVDIRPHNKINGYGAYANKRINKGQLIGEYTGIIGYKINDREFYSIARGSNLDDALANDNSAYLMLLMKGHPHFIFLEHENLEGRDYTELLIDAEKYRNEMGFANHSRFPNAKFMYVIKCSFAEKIEDIVFELSIYFVAIQDIEPGTEIMYHYGLIYEQIFEKHGFLDLRPTYLCYGCSQASKVMSSCGRCKIATYCSSECQKGDWSSHKKYCHKK